MIWDSTMNLHTLDRYEKMETLYEMLKSGRYKEILKPNFFPDVETTSSGVFIKSSNVVKEDSFSPTLQQILYVFDNQGNQISEVTKGYLPLYPNYSILKVSGNEYAPEVFEVIGAYSLKSDEYKEIKYKNPAKVTVFGEEDQDTVEDKIYYVPNPESADAFVRAKMSAFLENVKNKHTQNLRSRLGLF